MKPFAGVLRKKRIWPLIILIMLFLIILARFGPAKLTLAQADLRPGGAIAAPSLMSENPTLADWQNRYRGKWLLQLQEHVYGYLPDDSWTEVTSKRIVLKSAFNDKGIVEEYALTATASFNDIAAQTDPFNMIVVRPKTAVGPVPVILMQTFCPNHDTVPITGISRPPNITFSCSGDGFRLKIMLFVFGRYIATPPIENILDQGYALATVFPSEFIPDQRRTGLETLKALSRGYTDDQTRWGAIAAWAWGYSRMIDALQTEAYFMGSPFISYGHSRYGKSAMLAGAVDDRIHAVISHQSGTGGASLNKNKKGESVGEITESYPHWFSKSYASYSGREADMPVDQHALLALIAPKPVLLGNARRDVWSDPNSAFRAAMAADGVYALYKKQGLEQKSLSAFIPDTELSFYIRSGTHGVVEEDWPAFFEFLDAHIK